ncbi:CHAP domain-containing protein [Mesorhizobium sp.]|uniref:CHAP domain-containing protein n=1 Tax=Mesorhizobium sp. TaxID=1871066 RepID=UPI000FE6AE0A|nr:CHAP domain-containing protein [Mesorhizobium sp.]RWN62419.1 MAG: CHAP domain-containing protein [Mesorhizobium sp.]
MGFNRRQMLAYGIAVTAGSLSVPWYSKAIAQETIEELDFSFAPPVQWAAGEAVPTLDEYQQSLDAVTGPENPFKSERKRAAELLLEMDKFSEQGKSPFQIAEHFLAWRKGNVENDSATDRKDRQYYTREWPVRGNPVIMGFFDATGFRTPSGDTTYWCAAFVSDCIKRSLMSRSIKDRLWPYNQGAASAAYRSFGNSVDTPQQGDLVVFRNSGEAWRGHIGFVYGIEGNVIRVLGGNQGAQNEYNGGEVNVSAFNQNSARLKFHSFRRHEILS